MPPDTPTPINTLQLLHLLQLSSPTLPIGGFAWSQGLETAIDRQWLKGEADLADWLIGVMQTSFVHQEWPLLQRLMSNMALGNWDDVVHWNAVSLALRETAELRQQDLQTGAALIKLLSDLKDPGLSNWHQSETSYLTAFSLAAMTRSIPEQAACTAVAWNWLENQIAAALKSFPMGQTAGQRIFHQLVTLFPGWLEQSKAITDDSIGLSVPGVVMASMLHEHQYSRLFRS